MLTTSEKKRWMFSVCVRVELLVASTNRNPVASPVASQQCPGLRQTRSPPRESSRVMWYAVCTAVSFRPLDSWFAYQRFLNCVHIVPLNDRPIKNYEFERWEKETIARYFKAYIQRLFRN